MRKLKHTYSNCNQYTERDIEQLGDHYMVHIDAMTVEGLHSKSSIAAELAFRDQRIAELEKEASNTKGLWVTSNDLQAWKLEERAKGVGEALTKVKRMGGGFLHECLFEDYIHDLQSQIKALKEKFK